MVHPEHLNYNPIKGANRWHFIISRDAYGLPALHASELLHVSMEETDDKLSVRNTMEARTARNALPWLLSKKPSARSREKWGTPFIFYVYS
jgi:hypothetical protein